MFVGNPFGYIDLDPALAFARMYKGVTTDEDNFIGYGFGLMDWENIGFSSGWAPINTSASDSVVDDSLRGLEIAGNACRISSMLFQGINQYFSFVGFHHLFQVCSVFR